jgi:hypothetical protein
VVHVPAATAAGVQAVPPDHPAVAVPGGVDKGIQKFFPRLALANGWSEPLFFAANDHCWTPRLLAGDNVGRCSSSSYVL